MFLGGFFPKLSFTQHYIKEITNSINCFQCRALSLVKDCKSMDEAEILVPSFPGSISKELFVLEWSLGTSLYLSICMKPTILMCMSGNHFWFWVGSFFPYFCCIHGKTMQMLSLLLQPLRMKSSFAVSLTFRVPGLPHFSVDRL